MLLLHIQHYCQCYNIIINFMYIGYYFIIVHVCHDHMYVFHLKMRFMTHSDSLTILLCIANDGCLENGVLLLHCSLTASTCAFVYNMIKAGYVAVLATFECWDVLVTEQSTGHQTGSCIDVIQLLFPGGCGFILHPFIIIINQPLKLARYPWQ